MKFGENERGGKEEKREKATAETRGMRKEKKGLFRKGEKGEEE